MNLDRDNYCRHCRGPIEKKGGEGPWIHVASWNQRHAGVKVGPDCPGEDVGGGSQQLQLAMNPASSGGAPTRPETGARSDG